MTGALKHVGVKESVFPFARFPGVDTVLGPEMKSTGEVMGVADNFGEAFAKAQLAAGQKLPTQGAVFISVTDSDKRHVAAVARKFVDMGFKLVATSGTADVLDSSNKKNGLRIAMEVKAGTDPKPEDALKNVYAGGEALAETARKPPSPFRVTS